MGHAVNKRTNKQTKKQKPWCIEKIGNRGEHYMVSDLQICF